MNSRYRLTGEDFRVGFDVQITVDIRGGPIGIEEGRMPRAHEAELEDIQFELHHDAWRAAQRAYEEIKKHLEKHQADMAMIRGDVAS